MPEIKFSHNYPKLRDQKTALLIHVEATQRAKLNAEMVEIDTIFGNNEHYPLPNGTVIVLTFSGDKRIPFTTIRRYGASKMMWYESQVGKVFDIVLIQQPKPAAVQENIPLGETSGQ